MNTYIPIPIIETGEIDYNTQKTIADNIELLNEKLKDLEASKYELENVYVKFEMSENLSTKKISLNDYFDLERGKVISKPYVNSHKGNYPVYSTKSDVFGYIDTFMENGNYLLWNTDGLAGYIKIATGRFSFTNIVGIMRPKKNIDSISLEYLKYYLEPIFRLNKKGREGIDGKNEYTKLNCTMIRDLDIKIPIPINENGEFDLEMQNNITNNYRIIEEVKNNIINSITSILDKNII